MPRIKTVPLDITLVPGTPVKIRHSDGRNKVIEEQSWVEEDRVSAKSHLDPSMLEGMQVSRWQICITHNKNMIKYYSQVRSKDLQAGKSIYMHSKTNKNHSYARTMNYRMSYSDETTTKQTLISVNNVDPSLSETFHYMQAFIQSKLKHLPPYYGSCGPCSSDCQELADFITSPEDTTNPIATIINAPTNPE